MAIGSCICKGLGITEAGTEGREGSVEEVGLGGGLCQTQWGGGNCLLKKGRRD